MQGIQKRSLFDQARPSARQLSRHGDAAESIGLVPPPHLRDELAFYPSIFCSISLPMKQQQGSEFRRENGPYTLSVMTPQEYGIPFGCYPRGILAYICSQAVKKANQEQEDPRFIELGDNVSDFMEKVTGSRMRTGGQRGNGTLFDRQFFSLANSSINYSMPGSEGGDSRQGGRFGFVDKWEKHRTWRIYDRQGTDPKEKRKISLVLNDDFYADVVAHSVPLDDAVLRALWPSPLLIDIYTWITFRANSISKKPGQRMDLKWSHLVTQFGSEYAASSLGRFRQSFRKAFALVRAVYDPFDPDCIRMEEVGDTLIFRAKRPSVQALDRPRPDRLALIAPANIPKQYSSSRPKAPQQDQPALFLDMAIDKEWLTRVEFHLGRKLQPSEADAARDLFLSGKSSISAVAAFEQKATEISTQT